MAQSALNLPTAVLQIRNEGDHEEILDVVRKKWLVLTPEEWVRQNLVMYMHTHLGYPLSLLEIEKGLTLNNMHRRADIVVNGKDGKPIMLVECKAPSIPIKQEVFDQAARYNITFRVPYLLISNGLKHFCCKLDRQTEQWTFLKNIPEYKTLVENPS